MISAPEATKATNPPTGALERKPGVRVSGAPLGLTDVIPSSKRCVSRRFIGCAMIVFIGLIKVYSDIYATTSIYAMTGQDVLISDPTVLPPSTFAEEKKKKDPSPELFTSVPQFIPPLEGKQVKATATEEKYVETQQQETDSPPFTIFYNVYVPRNSGEEIVNRTMQIIEEQIGQVGHSYATSLSSMVNLHYVTIGMRDAVKATEMQIICKQNRIQCSHVAHHDAGLERVTLQAVKDFCEPYGADDSHRVAYLHSKGSYNPSSYQQRWRRRMTMAVTSEMCLKPKNDTCNLCGLMYMPMWVSFMPGNMWAAKCSYVNKLLPLESYIEKNNDLMGRQVNKMTHNKTLSFGVFQNKGFQNKPDLFGLERYADEHWVGGHPSVIPCDVFNSISIQKLLHWEGNVSITDFVFSMAPHDPVQAAWYRLSVSKTKDVLRNKILRIKEYVYLGGKLFLWLNLYNEIPPDSSWVWDYFPDGTEWRQAMVEHQGTSAGNAQLDTRMDRLLHILQHGSFPNASTVNSPLSSP
jgi:hypothetical protein